MRAAASFLGLGLLVSLVACGTDTDERETGGSNRPFAVEEVDRFDEPWAMAFLPGSGDLLITERSGTLHLRDAGSGETTEIDGVPEVVHAGHVALDGESSGDVEEFDMGERIRAVEEGPDGAIWLLEDAGGGRLLKLTPRGSA